MSEKYCKEKVNVNVDNLEGVYKAPLKSLVVSKPNSGSTIGGQVNVNYLQFANIFVFRIWWNFKQTKRMTL